MVLDWIILIVMEIVRNINYWWTWKILQSESKRHIRYGFWEKGEKLVISVRELSPLRFLFYKRCCMSDGALPVKTDKPAGWFLALLCSRLPPFEQNSAVLKSSGLNSCDPFCESWFFHLLILSSWRWHSSLHFIIGLMNIFTREE